MREHSVRAERDIIRLRHIIQLNLRKACRGLFSGNNREQLHNKRVLIRPLAPAECLSVLIFTGAGLLLGRVSALNTQVVS